MMKNGVMLQAYEWNTRDDGSHYNRLKKEAGYLASLGITGVWMPPASKGTSLSDVGYGSYDYYDLGEFDQKGGVRTKYGTKEELKACIKAFQDAGIEVYADLVLNHKGGADETEVFQVVKVNPDNRKEVISEPMEIEGWTHFTFPGRKGKYSDFEWHSWHFTGVDYDERTGENAIYKILGEGKDWSPNVSGEKGSFDYLMNADIDHSHPEVKAELFKFVDWIKEELNLDGIRFDALKHISSDFVRDLSQHLLEEDENFYMVGEYWQDDDGSMDQYLDQTKYGIDLFDVPLHFNFFEASRDKNFDMRTIFDDTLVKTHPSLAVTFVDNHDSQRGQSLESFVQPWFREIAYALILLRKDGYPCIFFPDLFGYEGQEDSGLKESLEKLLKTRQDYVYGEQDDYFETPTKIGWVLRGDEEHAPLAVLISTGDADQEEMFVGEEYAGKTFVDLSGKNEEIQIDEEGKGLFTVAPGAVTYWTVKEE